ncbi:MAG: Ig-like domain-containing protein, partial [Massilia sp.]
RPTATIVVADTALAAGETSLVTFTFSEAVTGFTNADLTVANGTLSAVSSSDGGITWTATLTPTTAITDTTNLITLDDTGVQDIAGNTGTGTTNSNNYAIDTARPSATIVVADTALAIGETSLVTFTFSEAVSGFTNADLSIANGTLSAVSSSDGGITWTATFTPTAGIADTTNLITLANTGVQDAAGNTGIGNTDSNNYAIDTARPTATIVVADTALAAGETSLVTFTFSESVAGFTVADLTVANGSVTGLATSDGGVTWTATFTPTAGVNDATNLITLANAGVQDTAGNVGTGTTDSNNYAIDTVRPTASIVVGDTALAAGETSLVTFTFSEAVTSFTNADLTVANGTLSAVSSSDGGITWTATLTPTAAITDTTNLITLDNTGVQDVAGNAGTGSTSSNNYAIDTARPNATIVVADTALAIGETSLVTFTFSEAVSGFTNADLTVVNGTLSAVSSSDGGVTWTATFTPTTGISDTTNLITLANTGVQDAAGNTGIGSTDSNNYAIDTARPTATIVVADTALAAGETSLVTFTFSEAVTGFTNADLTVANGVLSAVSTSDGGITWTATFTPTAGITDATNLISLNNAGVQDVAGNAGAGTTDSNNYAIDNVRPTATITLADNALAAGETSLVTFSFSEAVSGFTNADLTVANGSLSAVSSSDGGLTWTATFTPTAGVTDTSNLITLDNTGVQDAAGNTGLVTTDSNNYAIDTARPTASIVVADNALFIGETSLVTIVFSEPVSGFSNADLTVTNGTLSAVSSQDGGLTWTATFTPAANISDATNVVTLANTGVQDAAGNTGLGSTDSNNYAIDTTPAATPGVPVLAASSDTGSSNSDHITNDNTVTVTGSAVDGTTITLYDSDGSTALGSTVATGGAWSITSSTLADGTHALTVVASKGGLNPSARSGPLQVVVDTVAPSAPGMPSTDTNAPVSTDPLPVFHGAGAEPNALITLRSGATTIATAQADANGNWQTGAVALGGGQFSITATATDAAGNTGPASAPRALYITGAVPQELPPMPIPHPHPGNGPLLEEFNNDAPISLAIDGPFSRSPLASTIDKAAEQPLAFAPPRDTASLDADIAFTLPTGLFADLELVSLRARQLDGQPLPEWLIFDPINRSFHGRAPVGAIPGITIEVIGVDRKGVVHRATVKVGNGGVPREAPAPQRPAAALPPRLSGMELLAALGIAEPAARQSAAGHANEGTAPGARHLSGQLSQAAQRFAQEADATLRHLEQIDQQATASEST